MWSPRLEMTMIDRVDLEPRSLDHGVVRTEHESDFSLVPCCEVECHNSAYAASADDQDAAGYHLGEFPGQKDQKMSCSIATNMG